MLNVIVTYESNPPVTVLLLDCDTVPQAKEKMLDVIFKVPKNHSAIIINHITFLASIAMELMTQSVWFHLKMKLEEEPDGLGGIWQ